MPYLSTTGRWNKNQKYSFFSCTIYEYCPFWFRVTPARHCCLVSGRPQKTLKNNRIMNWSLILGSASLRLGLYLWDWKFLSNGGSFYPLIGVSLGVWFHFWLMTGSDLGCLCSDSFISRLAIRSNPRALIASKSPGAMKTKGVPRPPAGSRQPLPLDGSLVAYHLRVIARQMHFANY